VSTNTISLPARKVFATSAADLGRIPAGTKHRGMISPWSMPKS